MEGCKLYEAGVAVLSLLNRCQSIGDTELFPSQCSPLLICVFVRLDDQKLSSPYRGYIHSIFSIYIIDWDLKALCSSLSKPHSWVLVPNSVPGEWEEARNWLNAAVLPHGFLKFQLVSLAHLSQIYDSIFLLCLPLCGEARMKTAFQDCFSKQVILSLREEGSANPWI